MPEGLAAGYVRPWVVTPGARVALHAHLPHPTSVEVVRIACANAERHADGRPWGPPERIEPVRGGTLGTSGPAPQPLLPGTRVRVRCDGLPDWRALALVVALKRRPRGGAGAVLAVTSGDGIALEMGIEVSQGERACVVLRDGTASRRATREVSRSRSMASALAMLSATMRSRMSVSIWRFSRPRRN
ncbi:MAG TPA: hypothetical protein PKC20_17180, partial [Burkholderiaceae bacterium]|nr:hypothetical protein [Burkholderiaceae bacterium]